MRRFSTDHELGGTIAMNFVGYLYRPTSTFCNGDFPLFRWLQCPCHMFVLGMRHELGCGERWPFRMSNSTDGLLLQMGF